jgi:hypothetical protein
MFISVISMVTIVTINHIVSINVHIMVIAVASLGSTSQVPVPAVLLLAINVATDTSCTHKI